MLAIHQNGTSTTSPNTTSPSRASRDPARRPRRRPARGALISASVARPQKVAADQDDADHEQRHQEQGDRNPPPPPELVEGDVVGVRREDVGRGAGPPP